MFRIGDFSRLARVTIKTLHHYDEAGLLQPSHVDRQAGYRYYAAAQLETLQRILLLKDLGFALDEIRQLLAAAQIAASDAAVGAVWSRIVGTAADGQYGRPFAFHQQAQRADWAGAWSKVEAPVLALYGEYDWFESDDATSLIARIANAKTPGRGTFAQIPRMNHHFAQYPNLTAAFREKDGTVNPEPAVSVMLAWLEKIFAKET